MKYCSRPFKSALREMYLTATASFGADLYTLYKLRFGV